MYIIIMSKILDKIPGLFKTIKSENTNNIKKNRCIKMTVIPEFNSTISYTYSISEKIDGSCRLLYNNKVWKRRDIKKNSKTGRFKTPPSTWEEFSENHYSVDHRIGFIPIDINNKEDKWDKTAIDYLDNTIIIHTKTDTGFITNSISILELPQMVTMEFIGPKVQGNPYNLEKHGYYIHGSYIISDLIINVDDPQESLDNIKKYIIKKNINSFFEGIVIKDNKKYYKFHKNYI